jgi:hypothetical protein
MGKASLHVFSKMTNNSVLRSNHEASPLNESIQIYDDYEQQLIKQSAADALQQHSYMLMHSLSHHEHPFKMRSRLLGVMSGLVQSLKFWLADESSTLESS